MEREVQRAIHDISSNKSLEAKGIPIELIKAAGEEEINAMTILCQKIWISGEWSKDWKR